RFTTHFPVALDVPGGDWGGVLKAVKEQLRAIPGRGLGYDALRYLSEPGAPGQAMHADPLPPISFNYHGQWDAGASRTGLAGQVTFGDLGTDMGPAEDRPYLIDVVGMVVGGRLEFRWFFSGNVFDETTVRTVADALLANLR